MLNLLEPWTPRRMFQNIGLESSWGCKRMRGAVVEADAIGSSSWSGRKRRACSWSGRNRGAAAGSGHKRKAADEADAIGPGSSSWFEADASGEQQLKRTQSGGKRTQSGNSSSELSGAGVIKFWGPGENWDTGSLFSWDYGDRGSPFSHDTGLLTVSERGGSSWASEATCTCN